MNASHFAELVRMRFHGGEPRTFRALEIPCGKFGRITVAPRYYLRDDGKTFNMQRVYTGGLTLIGTAADPAGVLGEGEGRRVVRVRAGWTIDTIAISLGNMYEHVVRMWQLVNARSEERELRRDQARAVSQ